uniref:C2H2-type domain-containing protein n=1 Tax=Hucho hucho TaxID=62062 RepID=A0A4W5QDA0_9TELE
QSGETEEGEPDLLIIKVEGEADDQDSRSRHPARTLEGSREPTTQPAAATTEDPAFQPRGNNNYNNTAMRVSGSDVVLLQSETGNVNQGPQQHTGFEPRAERQSLDTKCDMNGGINLLRDSLNQGNAPTIRPVHPDSMRDTTQLVSPSFRHTEKNTGTHFGTGNAGEANKFSWHSLASLHRHSEIPGRGTQEPAHSSLPVGHFRPSATNSSHLSNLATDVTPDTVERPYGCPSCHKKFVHESDLQQHVVIHTRKRGYACTLCEKSFVSPSKLQVHQNVHTGEKPFSCAQCGRRFSHSGNLKRHQKLHH